VSVDDLQQVQLLAGIVMLAVLDSQVFAP
jgi:hypothetical protein